MKKFTLRLRGYGCDLFVANMDQRAYDYFIKKNIDFKDYAFNFYYKPRPKVNYLPFKPGNRYDKKPVYAGRGPYLDKGSTIEVFNCRSKRIWRSSLTIDKLKFEGCKVKNQNIIVKHNDGQASYYILEQLKGIHLNDIIHSTVYFDPSKIICEFHKFGEYQFLASIKYERRLLSDASESPEGIGLDVGIFI